LEAYRKKKDPTGGGKKIIREFVPVPKKRKVKNKLKIERFDRRKVVGACRSIRRPPLFFDDL